MAPSIANPVPGSQKPPIRSETNVNLKTPVAILGVRGTSLWVGPLDGATGVLDGLVDVSSVRGIVSLHADQGTMVGDNGSLNAPKSQGQAKKGSSVRDGGVASLRLRVGRQWASNRLPLLSRAVSVTTNRQKAIPDATCQKVSIKKDKA